MQEHLNKAKHNEDFHNCIQEKFPELFYDWKIVVVFYAAIHYLKAFGVSKGVNMGDTHEAISQNCNPRSRSKIINIQKDLWDNYHLLYQYSRNARYNGFKDTSIHNKLMASEYNSCKVAFTAFKIILRGEGVN